MPGLESTQIGSSPRVRGTVLWAVKRMIDDRFIPAGAGNGKRWVSSGMQVSVHPRGCGERLTIHWCANTCNGSSPRVRGTEHTGCSMREKRRFIPAGAGNGLLIRIGIKMPPVHPRGCGERTVLMLAAVGLAGSSPRVRGTVTGQALALGKYRFIPAGAGNGGLILLADGQGAVHPRGCGERPAWAEL